MFWPFWREKVDQQLSLNCDLICQVLTNFNLLLKTDKTKYNIYIINFYGFVNTLGLPQIINNSIIYSAFQTT